MHASMGAGECMQTQCDARNNTPHRPPHLALIVTALTACNAGLLLVDHIHFQYNGLLLGILWCSVAAMSQGRDVLGGALYTILVHAKHLYAVAGPLYAVYILSHDCRRPHMLRRFLTHAATVLTISAMSLWPFRHHLHDLLARLFPFHRGLLHAYWAPNAYALYAFVDKALSLVLPNHTHPATLTGGLVGVASLHVLPTPSSTATLLLTLLAMTPMLIYIARRPKPVMFLDAITYTFLCAFMFGYHVHEKAILNCTVLAAAGAMRNRDTAQQYVLLSTAGHVGLMPLVYTTAEYPVTVLLVVLHLVFSLVVFRRVVPGFRVGPVETVYVLGMLVLEVYKRVLHGVLLPQLPFLPLMLTSVYCALGIGWVCFTHACRYVYLVVG